MWVMTSVETLGYFRMSLRDSDRRPGQGNFRKALGLGRMARMAREKVWAASNCRSAQASVSRWGARLGGMFFSSSFIVGILPGKGFACKAQLSRCG